jgi:hypothetical protein
MDLGLLARPSLNRLSTTTHENNEKFQQCERAENELREMLAEERGLDSNLLHR